MDTKRLERVRSFIEERGWKYSYSEEDGYGSIDFEYRGLAYHIWEFDDGERGVETNLRDVVELKKANDSMIASIDDVVRIHEEGTKKRIQTHEDLMKMKDELSKSMEIC
ncbi:MAG: toxic anion resistance protein [Lachnospiraceae bacterium]|nr:toxic anion resistance protein [Lachnospiraceae bacterium]